MKNLRNYLDLSTAHIKKENIESILNTQSTLPTETNLYGYPYEYGTFVTIGEINIDSLMNDYNNGFEDIITIVRFCLRHEIDLIRFDNAADFMEDFQSYDW